MIARYKEAAVFYTVTGTGAPVVLLHGFLETSSMWQEVVPYLSASHSVICIDLLGHGKTECVGYVHRMEEMAQAVCAVLDVLSIERAALVGHSMGGYVALALAALKPTMVTALCLVNSTSSPDSEARKNVRDRASKTAKRNYPLLVKTSIDQLFDTAGKKRFNAQIQQLCKEALDMGVRGYIAANEGMKLRENTSRVFSEVPRKLMVFSKADTVLCSNRLQAEAAEVQAAVTELEGGHMSVIEHPKLITELIYNFLK